MGTIRVAESFFFKQEKEQKETFKLITDRMLDFTENKNKTTILATGIVYRVASRHFNLPDWEWEKNFSLPGSVGTQLANEALNIKATCYIFSSWEILPARPARTTQKCSNQKT